MRQSRCFAKMAHGGSPLAAPAAPGSCWVSLGLGTLLLLVVAGSIVPARAGERGPQPAAQRTNDERTLAEFSRWAQEFRAGLRTADEGVALTANRRAVLARWITSDPQSALYEAVSPDARKDLPPAVARLLEEHLSGQGEYVVSGGMAVAGQRPGEALKRSLKVNGKTYRAYVPEYLEDVKTTPQAAFRGIALDDVLALGELRPEADGPDQVSHGAPPAKGGPNVAAGATPPSKGLFAWGSNRNGQLGSNGRPDADPSRPAPVAFPADRLPTAIAAGQYHSLAACSDGTVWAWGANDWGQLGTGSNTDCATPVQVTKTDSTPLTGIQAVAGGGHHSLALDTSGAVWSVGYTDAGQGGYGVTDALPTHNRATRVAMTDLRAASQIAAGMRFSLAIRRSDRTVWAWGDGSYGQLGDGTTFGSRNVPAQVPGLNGIVAITAGNHHALALKSDGTVWAWGRNNHGQLGLGHALDQATPTRVPGLSGIAYIGAGPYQSFAARRDGRVFAWGANNAGQLGTGDTASRTSPMPIKGFVGARKFCGGLSHMVFLKGDGSLWTAGANDCGQLGDGSGSGACAVAPVRVSHGWSAMDIGAGSVHGLALRSADERLAQKEKKKEAPDKAEIVRAEVPGDLPAEEWKGPEGWGVRSRRIDLDPLFTSGRPLVVGKDISLKLFDDVTVAASTTASLVNVNGTTSTTAHIKGSRWGRVFIAHTGSELQARVLMPESNEVYAIEYNRADGRHYALQLDPGRYYGFSEQAHPVAPAALPLAALGANTAGTATLMAGTSQLPGPAPELVSADTTVDVMVVYTATAYNRSGSIAAINNRIATGIAMFNDSLLGSGIGCLANLVYTGQVSYTEVDNGTDLAWLRTNATVATLRSNNGADFVQLINDFGQAEGNGGGIGYSPGGTPPTYQPVSAAYAFTVVNWSIYAGYSGAHEIGHNMGAGHPADQTTQPGPTAYSAYASGWHWHPSSGQDGYSDLMTYNSGGYFTDGLWHTQVALFSNPSIYDHGMVTGNASTADNARVLRETKGTCANYVATKSLAPSITTQPTDQTVAEQATATFSLVASGTSLTYQWRRRNPGDNVWSDISGATSSSYTTPTTTAGDSGTLFRCTVIDANYRSTTSYAAELTVTAATGNGTWINTSGGSWPVGTGNWTGAVIANGAGNTADFSTLNLTANRTVTLDGPRTIGNLTFGDTTPSNDWTLSPGTRDPLTLDVSSGTPTITVNNRTATIGLVLAGTKGLIKAGSGTLSFSGAHTYVGQTTVNAGTLTFATGGRVNLTPLVVNNGATLDFNGGTYIDPFSSRATPINVNAGGTMRVLQSFAAGYNYEPAIALNGGTLSLTGSQLSYGLVISGAGSSITVTVAGRRVVLWGYSSSTPNTVQVTAAGSGATISSGLEFAQGTMSYFMDVADGSAASDLTISGVVQGAGPWSKTGTGTLTLTGANTYTGTTTVSAGTLVVNDSLDAQTSNVSVSSGATLRGTGTINRPVTPAAGAIIWPGSTTLTTDTKGTLTIVSSSAVNFNSGGKLTVRVSGGPGALQADRLLLSGAGGVTLGGSSVLGIAYSITGGTYSNERVMLLDAGGERITASFGSVSPSLPVGCSVIYLNAGLNPVTPAVGTPARYVYFLANGSPTPVRVAEFAAEGAGGGALVKWGCGSELENAGFHVWRRVAGAGEDGWTRRSETLIPGGLTTAAATEYAWYDEAEAATYEYRLESVSMAGVSEFYGALAEVTVEGAGEVSAPNEKASEVVRAAYAEYRQRGARAECVAELQRGATGAARRVGQVTALTAKPAWIGWSKGQAPGSVVATTPVWTGLSKMLLGIRATEPLAAATQLKWLALAPFGETAVPVKVSASAIRGADPRPPSTVPATGGAKGKRPALPEPPRTKPEPLPPTEGRTTLGPVAKVVYREKGLLKVREVDLPAGFDAGQVTAEREGQAYPILARTTDGLLLYAPGYEDEYTDRDAIFLRPTGRDMGIPPAPYSVPGLFAGQEAETTTEATATERFHEVWYNWGNHYGDGYYYEYPGWFSRQYLTDGSVATFTVSTPGAKPEAGTLSVDLWSFSNVVGVAPDHKLQAVVNGQGVGEVSWDGGHKALTLSFAVPAGVLKDGANTVELVTPVVAGVSWQFSMVYAVSLSYTRKLESAGALAVAASSGAAAVCEAKGLGTEQVYVVDKTEAGAAQLVGYEAVAAGDGTWTVRFERRPGREYLIVPAGGEVEPQSVALRYIEPLRGRIGYLAVGGAEFEEALSPLLERRTAEGLGAVFADQERLFDAYGYGRYGPEGIRRAVRAAVPAYLLLVGRTTYDYRNYEGQNLGGGCPTLFAATSTFGQSPGDAQYGDLGRGYPEVAVGRYPANNAADLSVAVARTLSYTGRASASGPGGLMVADRLDPSAGDFAAEGEELIGAGPRWAWERSYLGVTEATAGAVTARLTEASGWADVITFVGHGSSSYWAKEVVLDAGKAGGWSGNVVLVQATCNGNYFLHNTPAYGSIAKALLFQGGGGVAASVGSGTWVYPQAMVPVTKAVLEAAQGSGVRWGEALLAGQRLAAERAQGRSGIYDDLAKSECLLGDPALPVEQAKPEPAPAEPPRLRAESF